jgi:hypothetical protein
MNHRPHTRGCRYSYILGLGHRGQHLLYLPIRYSPANQWSMRWRNWLRHYATCRIVAGSIPSDVSGLFSIYLIIPALGLTHPLTEITRNLPGRGVKSDRCVRLIISLPSLSQRYRNCEILDVSQPHWPPRPQPSSYLTLFHRRYLKLKKKTPWSESASELYRSSDRRLSKKLLPTFADRECHVVSVTDPYGRILEFSGQEPLLFYQVAPQLYSRGWVDPVPDPLLFVW